MATFYTPKAQKSNKQAQSKAFEISIDAHDHAGNGLCLSSKPITVVHDALLGELCRVKLNKQSKKVNFADTTKIIKPSPLRVTPFCEYYGQCGGCSLQHTTAKHGLALKEQALKDFLTNKLTLAKAFVDEGAWDKPVLSDIDYSDDPVNTHYRRRVRLAVDARNKQKVKIGFRAQGSDTIIDIPKCAVASSAINNCLPALRQVLVQLPSIHRIGHIIITQGEDALQVAIFSSQSLCKKSRRKLSELAQNLTIEIVLKAQGEDAICLHSNSVIHNASQTLSKDGAHIGHSENKNSVLGSALIIEDMPTIKLAIQSTHFLQVNKAVNQGMLKKAKAWLGINNTHTLYDFFCGAGNFALSFAKSVNQVKGFEGVKEMVHVARLNADNLGFDNCEFRTTDLSSTQELSKLHFAENALVILDPSREGALELCQLLANKNIEKILYVSCNPNSFVRDAAYLLPRFTLEKVAALDMFPFTKHIEMMALFTLHK